MHGRHAIHARALNLASVGASVFMNAIAAAPGWRNLAIWAMPPIAYALASDTLIGVVHAWATRSATVRRYRTSPAGKSRKRVVDGIGAAGRPEESSAVTYLGEHSRHPHAVDILYGGSQLRGIERVFTTRVLS